MAMEICGIAVTEKFAKLFSELERSDVIVQKQKIEEMNELLDVMKKDEFRSVFTIELFDKMDKMIEEEKLSTRNASVLLKQLGYYKTLKGIRGEEFYLSSLHYRISMMIINGNKKKEGKDINLLVDLCECYLLLSYNLDSEEVSICVPCLLKVALNKKKIIEIQKEVEMALLSLSLIYQLDV
ncbi:uncharacterized protein MONOS_17223 [Monocercomonoides exilis]|uniref:uncharacterized protein n=1 Tax=Monocercomonoides exilis TaxID=2049356 RepID=UPI00355A55AD|nr:hypothetical protein MONOS_17223 [Monocercomonoides exilis]